MTVSGELLATTDPAPNDRQIRGQIVQLLEQRAASSSICPSEVARALLSEESAWRALMPEVRRVAVEMASGGVLQITQGGQPVDLRGNLVGPIRLRRGPAYRDAK